MLVGLSRAPDLLPAAAPAAATALAIEAVGAVVAPAGALGGAAVLACAERGIPVIAVENPCLLNVTAEALGLELVPSRRCYALVEWLQQRQAEVYPLDPGYQSGPLAPPPLPIRPVPVPLPEVARGERWAWANLPVSALAESPDWSIDFAGLLQLPAHLDPAAMVPGIRLFSRHRALAMAGWLAGLEPVRLEVVDDQLVLEAGLEDRWLLTTLPADEAKAAQAAFTEARQRSGGLQFIAIQSQESDPRLAGFWMLRDLPDA